MAHADMDGAVDRGGGRGEVRGQMIAVGVFEVDGVFLGLMVLETVVLLLSSSLSSAVVIIHRLTLQYLPVLNAETSGADFQRLFADYLTSVR